MRRGFSLLTAIFVMVLIGTLMTLALSMGTMTVKQTGDLYLKEQSRLLARSATEYAIFRISGNNFDSGCYTGESYTIDGIDINTTIRYIGNGFPSSCVLPGANAIQTVDSNGTAIIDVIVSYADPSTAEKIRFHRRTIQKP